MKLLNFGSLNLDYVYQVDHFVRAGETLSSLSMEPFSGGKGLNQSVALGRAGVPVWHAGAVGADDSAILLSALESASVHTELVRRHAGSSGHAIIQVARGGQNCIMLFGGANQSITKEEADDALSHFEAGDFLLLQNEISEIPYIMEQARARGMRIVLNPSPMNEKILALPLSYVDYLLLNEVEAADICGENAGGELLEHLTGKFPAMRIVLTLGKHGVEYAGPEGRFAHGIYQVPVVDTTAAGDTFTGFFIASIAKGLAIPEALRLASVASSIAVSRSGAAPSIPTLQEVEAAKLTPAG